MAKQVLVVDDDRNTVKFLSVLLSEHGYEPVPAYDGTEGLQKVEQSRPDLVILDVMMPKKSGFVLFRQLKQDPQYTDIPVLMLTGVTGVLEELEAQEGDTFERPYDSLRAALKQKIDEMREEGLIKPEMFMDKPVDPDSFIMKVRELLGS
ncbi:MAG: response regulator [Planctomycetota bacterium]|jgi:CheY-like chemotaxis protein